MTKFHEDVSALSSTSLWTRRKRWNLGPANQRLCYLLLLVRITRIQRNDNEILTHLAHLIKSNEKVLDGIFQDVKTQLIVVLLFV
jgi:hypothetical protein